MWVILANYFPLKLGSYDDNILVGIPVWIVEVDNFLCNTCQRICYLMWSNQQSIMNFTTPMINDI